MRRIKGLFIAAAILLLASPVGAQQEPQIVGRVTAVKPKVEMYSKFEDAFKRHLQWHKQNDPWPLWTWQIMAGERTGQYVVGTFGHHWEDFDTHAQLDAADQADVRANLAQYVESVVASLVILHPDVSRPPAGEAPLPLTEVVTYQIKIGSYREFARATKKIHEAIVKTNWVPYYLWYELADGGEHPAYFLVVPHPNFADFQPPKKPFEAMLEEVYGREEAESLEKSFDKTVQSVHSEVLRYRPDLSNQPEAK